MRFSLHYYRNRRLADRSFITEQMCIEAVQNPIHTEVQADGCIRFWSRVTLSGDEETRFLKVVTTPNGDCVITAHVDTNFARKHRRYGT